MNINDYTYHICDRFVLLFIAFIGLVGTSYIIVSGNLNSSATSFNGFSTEFGITLHNNAINRNAQSSKVEENNTILIEEEKLMPASIQEAELESASFSLGDE